jgi:hypothetical protein
MNRENFGFALAVLSDMAIGLGEKIRWVRDHVADWSQRHKNTTAFLLLALFALSVPTLWRFGAWAVS